MSASRAERRASLLLRCYPSRWRSRYGLEFTQLLIDDMLERPRSPARTLDVIRCGLLARASHAGLAGPIVDAERELRAGLAVLACAITAFLTFGIAIWAQLTIGWQWSAPRTAATTAAMDLMSAAALALAVIALVAALPVVCTLVRARSRRLLRPALLATAGVAVLTAGVLHFGHGWPGTGGHPWSGRGLVPSGVASWLWAVTLSISSYWAHPGALSSFPIAEVAWMATSPLALLATGIGVARIVRRLPLSRRTLRYEARVGSAAAAAMVVFVAGAGSWVITGSSAPRGLFRVGAIDAVALGVMASAMLISFHAIRRNGARA